MELPWIQKLLADNATPAAFFFAAVVTQQKRRLVFQSVFRSLQSITLQKRVRYFRYVLLVSQYLLTSCVHFLRQWPYHSPQFADSPILRKRTNSRLSTVLRIKTGEPVFVPDTYRHTTSVQEQTSASLSLFRSERCQSGKSIAGAAIALIFPEVG